MLKHIAQGGTLGSISMAEESVVSSSSSVTSNGELSEEVLQSIRRSSDPIKTNHDWPGKIPRKTKTNSTQMGSLWES